MAGLVGVGCSRLGQAEACPGCSSSVSSVWTGRTGRPPASPLPSAAAEDDSDSDSNEAKAKELLAPSASISFMPPTGPGLAGTGSAPQCLCLRRKLFFYHLLLLFILPIEGVEKCRRQMTEGRKKTDEPSLFHMAAASTKELRPSLTALQTSKRWWCLHPPAWQKEARVVQASPAGRVGGGDVAQVSTTPSAYNYG